MIIPTRPDDEEQRLAELRALGILDTQDETLFDDIVKLGSYITGCPISLLSLIDADRQWFKARRGLDATETHRDISFCGHAIHHDGTFIVENALEDERFADNPLVTSDPSIRFYAGRPLVTQNGFRIGTLCAIDRVPKKLSAEAQELLESLARQATFLIEQRRNERTLEMTRRNSQALFEKSPLLIASMRGPEHVFDYINRPSAKLIDATEALGRPLVEVQPEARDNGLLQVVDRVYQTGTTKLVKGATFRVGKKVRHFDFVLTPRVGLDAKIDGVMGIIDDITDRRTLELEIKRLNDDRDTKLRKLASSLERAPIHIALLEGPEHRFVYANRLYRDCFLPSLNYLGKPLAEVFPWAEDQGYLKTLGDVYRTGAPFIGKETFYEQVVPAGITQQFYFNFLFEATTDARGRVTGILSAGSDVTEQVVSRTEISSKVDALRSERELREQFVATLSHDMQSPLTAAKVGAERLKRRVHDKPTIHKIADRIIGSIHRSERMVRNLLDANRLKAGQGLPIWPEPCCLNDIVEDAIDGLVSAHGRKIDIEAPSGRIIGSFDRDGIRRVVENLASNAIKYGDPAAPIRLSSQQLQGQVQIAVHNRGPAIPDDKLAALFEPHHRLDSAIESKQQGWGIGLALVKGIAQAHQGSVRVESTAEAGTTFYVTLPLKQAGHAQA